MTEKQGGSDVRANTTATPVDGGGPGREYRLLGPQVVLLGADVRRLPRPGQAPGGPPRPASWCRAWLPDGSRNVFRIQRLKDKLGNRSNASSEVEFDGAAGVAGRRGGPRRPVIIEMVNHTRLDCVLGAAGRHAAGLGRGRLHHARAPLRLRAAARSSSR
jgi:putative acyl-CoA dehydrogenase